jgi:hypothetical protein
MARFRRYSLVLRGEVRYERVDVRVYDLEVAMQEEGNDSLLLSSQVQLSEF